MKVLGLHVPFTRKETDTNAVTPIRPVYAVSSPFGVITEAFGGMWGRHLRIDNTQTLLAFSAVFACISLIAGDIAKLRLLLKRRQSDGTWREDTSNAFSPFLRKPNGYQTRLQFFQQWVTSKLIWGNTYVVLERDNRRIVVAAHVLDAQRVLPLVAPDGQVFYQLAADNLSGVQPGALIVPASEVIHDRHEVLFHPLVGVPPLYACAMSGTQGNRIQANSSRFFENMSRPSGQLTAPGQISDSTAARIKTQFEENFSGANIGRILVAGDGLKFEPFTIPAEQAQLIEQLKWTAEDVARAFLVPLHKIGAGPPPNLGNVAALNVQYYNDVLQKLIEAIELLIDDGLALPVDLSAEFDIRDLLRMDPKAQLEALQIGVGSSIYSPNEARELVGLPPVEGGEFPLSQQQYYSLADLAKREMPPPGPVAPAPPPATEPEAEDEEDEDEEDITEEELAFALLHARTKLECETSTA